MTETQFEELLTHVEPAIKKSDTFMRSALTPKIKLQIVLYLLATGCSLRTLSHLFRVSKPTISLMIPIVCDAVYNALKDYIKIPRSTEEWNSIEEGFSQKWNFPGCCGALDGKHVVLNAPDDSRSYYYNYKNQHSISFFWD